MPGDANPSITPLMSAEELRCSWQGRMLEYVRRMDQLGPAVLSLLADNYDDSMPFLLHAVFPGAYGVSTPAYCSDPMIDENGRIVADMIERDGTKTKNKIMFVNERQMEAVFRVLCDRLKLSDSDRRDVFGCILHWVKADRRLNPLMDPRDPDAKRQMVN